MMNLALPSVLLMILSLGIGPCDDASTRGGKVGGNRYFEASGEYPQYYIVLHLVATYDPAREFRDFEKALQLAQPVVRNLGVNRDTSQVRYIVVIIREPKWKDGGDYESAHCAARVFAKDDIISPKEGLARLVEATPPEARPFATTDYKSGMTAGGPIVVRHAKAVAEEQAATRPVRHNDGDPNAPTT